MGFKADPHMSHRLPDYLGAKAAPQRGGAQSCCRAGKGCISCLTVGKGGCLGTSCPQLLQGCQRAQHSLGSLHPLPAPIFPRSELQR